MADATSVISKALWICENLYKYCVAPDGGKRIRETGAIAPAGTLKHFRARFAFLWASEVGFNKRFFTEAAVRLGILKLLEKKEISIPCSSGIPYELWLQRETKTVLHLCQRSRRNFGSQLRFPAYRQQKSMDYMETLPMDLEAIWGESTGASVH